MLPNSTIAAISTPIGTAGIGVVRLSGADAIHIADKTFRPYGSKMLSALSGYQGRLGRILDENGAVVDEAIAFVYKSPRSYTGEDVVELSCHGGTWILRRVLRLCLNYGAAPATPGEFTKRAFLNGKLDLLQAEAVMGLIHAHGDDALRANMVMRDGGLSREISSLTDLLAKSSAHLAAWADYPDEDLIPVNRDELAVSLGSALNTLQTLISSYDRGSVLRHGADVAIAGKPNTGKSTLMNLLSRRDRSIVTDIPGTTRDVVEDFVQIGGVALRLLDTAGIRETADAVESIGVNRAKDTIAGARLVIAVFDSSLPFDQSDMDILALLKGKKAIAAINKSDLTSAFEQSKIKAGISRAVNISATTGQGREELERAIIAALDLDTLDLSAPMLTTERQRDALTLASVSLDTAAKALNAGITLDAVAIDIDCALDALLSLTGERVTDRIVDEIFSRFCVGK